MRNCLRSSWDRSSRTRRASFSCNAIGSQNWSLWPSPSSKSEYVRTHTVHPRVSHADTFSSHRRRNMKFTTRRRSCSLVSSTRMDTSSTRTSSRSVSSSRVEKYVKKMGGVSDLQLQFVRSSDLLYCIGCFVFAIGYTIHSQSAMCFFFSFRFARAHVREGNGGNGRPIEMSRTTSCNQEPYALYACVVVALYLDN